MVMEKDPTKDYRADNVELGGNEPRTGTAEGGVYPQGVVENGTGASYYNDLMSAMSTVGKAPAPTYDEGREKRLEVMAGAQGVAKALDLMGDAFAVGKGADVIYSPKKENDYVGMIMADREKYRLANDQYAQQEYLNRLRSAMGLAEAKGKDRAAATAAAQYKQTFDENVRQFDERQDAAAAAATEGTRQFDEKMKLEWAKLKDKTDTDKLRLIMSKFGKDAKNQFELIARDGNSAGKVTTEGELQAVLTAILNDPTTDENTLKKFAAFNAKLDGLSLNDIKTFVQDYWSTSPDAVDVVTAIMTRKSGGGGTTQAPPQYQTPKGLPDFINNIMQERSPYTRGNGPVRPAESEQPTLNTMQQRAKAMQDAVKANDADALRAALKGQYTDEQIEEAVKKYIKQ